MLDEESGITIKLKNQNYDIEISFEEFEGKKEQPQLKIVAIDKKTGKLKENTSVELKDNVIAYLIKELKKIDIKEIKEEFMKLSGKEQLQNSFSVGDLMSDMLIYCDQEIYTNSDKSSM
jgi:hypothetical protein